MAHVATFFIIVLLLLVLPAVLTVLAFAYFGRLVEALPPEPDPAQPVPRPAPADAPPHPIHYCSEAEDIDYDDLTPAALAIIAERARARRYAQL